MLSWIRRVAKLFAAKICESEQTIYLVMSSRVQQVPK